jgi:predicted O-methyltransferase YrrM
MTSRPSLSAEALASWDANATYWDDAITRDGNKYWRRLQEPSLQRLLGPKLLVANSGLGGLRALEFATGNGLCTRWLAREMRRQNLGHHCDILATDGSEEMLKTARRHFLEEYGEEEGERGGVSMRWRRVDVTSKEDLDTLVKEEGRFDIILINMALMDVADLQPLAKAVSNLLALNGV